MRELDGCLVSCALPAALLVVPAAKPLLKKLEDIFFMFQDFLEGSVSNGMQKNQFPFLPVLIGANVQSFLK